MLIHDTLTKLGARATRQARHTRRVRRASSNRSHPAAADFDVPAWVGTEEDPVWCAVRDEIATFTPMKDVGRAIQDCQVAVGRLAVHTEEPGPVGQAALRALHSLAVDVHHECRRAQQVGGDRDEIGGDARDHPTLWQWLMSESGSGTARRDRDPSFQRTVHDSTMVGRLTGAVATAMLVAIGLPFIALAVLLVTATATGIIRYQTNAEAIVTFRARYFWCLLGHLGDALVMAGATAGLVRHGQGAMAAVVAVTAAMFLFATIIRTAALQVGFYAERLRIERVVRVVALAVGLVAIGLSSLPVLLLMPITAAAYFGRGATRTFRGVWGAGATEFAWTLLTQDGPPRSHVLSAPLPGRSSSTSASQLLDEPI